MEANRPKDEMNATAYRIAISTEEILASLFALKDMNSINSCSGWSATNFMSAWNITDARYAHDGRISLADWRELSTRTGWM